MPGRVLAGPAHPSHRIAEVERAHAGEDRHQADDHAEVADAVDDERLVRRVGGALPLDVEADQQVRTNAHQFPEGENHRQVAGDHQAQHAEAEERQVLEEAIEAAAAAERLAVFQSGQRIGHFVQLFVHVAQRVDVDARGDERDHAEHGDGQRVDVVADGQR